MSAKTLPHIPINDCRDLQKLRSQWDKPTTLYHLYDPNLLKAMGRAFDAALEALARTKAGARPKYAGNWRC
jgi:hypothetical protein